MKNSANKKILLVFTALFILIFNSCLGLSMDIQLNKNGSGKLTIEYKISNMLGGLGTLDGNEKWPSVPVGRSDWERTIQRINGAKLSSFSLNKNDQDNIIKVTIDFDNPEALLTLIDPSGGGSSINMNGEFNIFLDMSDSSDDNSQYADIMPLVSSVFAPYNFSVSFSAPSNSTLTLTDADGKVFSAPSSAQIIGSGKKVSLTMGMKEFLEIPNSLVFRFNW